MFGKKIIKSPLNYIGGKYKLLPQLLPLFPTDIDVAIDLFCGGANISVNLEAKKIIAIDKCSELIGLLNFLKNNNISWIIGQIENTISKYQLSNSYEMGYHFYGTNSSIGLANVNKDKYLHLRYDFNKIKDKESFDYYVKLFTLIIFSYNNLIRFNSKNEYNVPVGKRDFNNKIRDNLIKFAIKLQSLDIDFITSDFRNFNYNNISFLYADPPYLISNATYNEQNAWTENDEIDLLILLDDLNQKNIKFALSNVLESKGKSNEILKKWSKKYNVHFLNHSYSNSNYNIKNREYKDVEVLITNY